MVSPGWRLAIPRILRGLSLPGEQSDLGLRPADGGHRREVSAFTGEPPRMPPKRKLRSDLRRLLDPPDDIYALAIALCLALLWWVAIRAPEVAIPGGLGPGALYIMRKQRLMLALTGLSLAGMFLFPAAQGSAGCWSLTVVLACAGTFPIQDGPSVLRLPHWTWAAAMILCTFCLGVTAIDDGLPSRFATGGGTWFSAYLAAGLVGQLVMAEARVIAWGEDGMVAVTRDILLGRITGGMLHDLAQPLNVISMASENLAYLIEQLDLDENQGRQLLERTDRIAIHTAGAADILTLFRGLARGTDTITRDGSRAEQTLRYALDRAIAATRSTLRHQVGVELSGEALDRPIPGRPGTFELLSVAALLSAFGAFLDVDGQRLKGTIVLRAKFVSGHVIVDFRGFDEAQRPLRCKPLDSATHWLVEQVAREAGGAFRCMPGPCEPTRLVLCLGYDAV